MNPTNEKLQLFLTAIRDAAAQSCQEKDAETAAAMNQQLRQTERELGEHYREQYDRALRQVRQQADTELSAYRTAARNRLAGLRQAYEDTVFADTRKALEEYVKTPAYADFLTRSAKRLADAVRRYDATDTVLYLRQADMNYADTVRAAFGLPCDIKAEETIRLGGLKLSSQTAKLLIDDTLETRLEQQRALFREMADLAIS